MAKGSKYTSFLEFDSAIFYLAKNGKYSPGVIQKIRVLKNGVIFWNLLLIHVLCSSLHTRTCTQKGEICTREKKGTKNQNLNT